MAGIPLVTVAPALSIGGGIVLSVLTIMLVWFGTFPGGMIDFIKSMISGISSVAITMVP